MGRSSPVLGTMPVSPSSKGVGWGAGGVGEMSLILKQFDCRLIPEGFSLGPHELLVLC